MKQASNRQTASAEAPTLTIPFVIAKAITGELTPEGAKEAAADLCLHARSVLLCLSDTIEHYPNTLSEKRDLVLSIEAVAGMLDIADTFNSVAEDLE